MKRYLFLILGVLLCTSCGKFLEEFSQDLAYARNCDDLDEILIGNGYMQQVIIFGKSSVYGEGYYPYIHVMDDDITMTVLGESSEMQVKSAAPYKNFYDWSDQLTIDPVSGNEWEDSDWKKIYGHIGYLNVIISYVEKFTSDSLEVRDRIEGEARFLRGAYYYLLTNFYANPYVRETASRDMGVPLNLTEDIDDKYFSRNTMEECYNAIVEDLQVAVEKLKGVKQSTIYRVNEAAARVLLSRVYLYMGEWQLALEEIEEAFKLDNMSLYDLNSFEVGGEDKILSSTNPEIIFTQGVCGTNTYGYGDIFSIWGDKNTGFTMVASEELLSLYNRYDDQGVEDLRLNTFFIPYDDVPCMINKVSDGGDDVFDCFVIRSAELYLNKAEAEAMLDKTEDAISTIKVLLNKRFKNGKIPNVDHLQGKELVSFIRDERRRELCFEAQRWFDLRRYAVSPKYPEKKSITHTTYDKNGIWQGDYVLQPYGDDPAWVLPIPGYEIVYNQGKLVDNPERKTREIKK